MCTISIIGVINFLLANIARHEIIVKEICLQRLHLCFFCVLGIVLLFFVGLFFGFFFNLSPFLENREVFKGTVLL